MSVDTVRIKSISDLHKALGYEKPKHSLITVIDASKLEITEDMLNTKVIYDMYYIGLKDKSCGLEYGRNSYDFDEGTLVFTAPRQVSSPTKVIEKGEIKGWMLFFHPELIRKSHLGEIMDEFSFFNYDVHEALHLSEDEEKVLNECVANIKNEYAQRIDNHSQRVIVSRLELLLNYCLRFYERQFNTRYSQNKDVLSQFEGLLKDYFKTNKHQEIGFPNIQYFADKICLSSHYLSDLLKKETGRTAKDYINDYVIEKAKNMLLASSDSISEVAYSLGFNYPHYFTRLFKQKTGVTPKEFRLVS